MFGLISLNYLAVFGKAERISIVLSKKALSVTHCFRPVVFLD